MPGTSCITDLPTVDVLIPVRNEENYIERCLNSFYRSDYDPKLLNIYVIDGGSTDDTIAITKQFQEKYNNLTILNNKNMTVPYALNLGIRHSINDIIFWAHGHGEYDSDYLRACVQALKNSEVASAGGLVIPKGRSFWGKVIATCLKSPFGMGFASYRTSSDKSVWADTVMGGCWRRKDVIKIGGFNEQWTRNQDSEFNIRLRESVGKLLIIPQINCRLYVRESLIGLIKQYFQYGFWRCKTIFFYPSSIKFRQIIPTIFVLSLISSIIINLWLFSFILVSYFFVNIAAVVKSTENNDAISKLCMLIIFPSMHISWGIGFISNVIVHFFEAVSKRLK